MSPGPAAPWLSVLMPTHNGARYLGRALESVAGQDRGDLEIIVADDDSSDATPGLLEEAARRLPLRLIPGARRGNWVASTNLCLQAARGRYVALLHQDDLWLPGRLQLLRETLAAPRAPELCFSAATFLDADDRPLGPWRAPLAGPLVAPEALLPALLVQNFIAAPAPAFLRQAALAVGGLDERLWYTADWDLWLRLGARGMVGYSARPTVGFRIHAESQTVARARSDAAFREQHELVFERHFDPWRRGLARPALARRVEAAARCSIAVNVALSAAAGGQPWRAAGVLGALARLGPVGLCRYLRDSRLHERVLARLRGRVTRPTPASRTEEPAYARRLAGLQQARWKRLLDVQRPYRRYLQGLQPGLTLDLGCGIGRTLVALPPGSVGVDHNPTAVELARARGLPAMTPDEFLASGQARPGCFDTLLLAHVAEHLAPAALADLLRLYLPLLRPGGRVVVITPQERGHRSDPTHLHFMDFEAVERVLREVGLAPEARDSFPFPRWAGRLFVYNEFVTIGRTA